MQTSSRQRSSFALLCALCALFLMGSGNALAHGGGHHRSRFKGSGTWKVSAPVACNTGQCYTAAGSMTINSISFDLTANGSFDPNTCKKVGKKKTCCANTMSGEFQAAEGTVQFSFTGRGCTSDTLETLKGPMHVDGVSGQFDGQTGAGALSAQVDPSTGEGPIKVSGAIHK